MMTNAVSVKFLLKTLIIFFGIVTFFKNFELRLSRLG